MNPFEMVVLIVAIVMIASVLKARYRVSSVDGYAGPTRDDPAAKTEADQLRAELRQLKDRVATLERIATDSTTALDHEIEQLRRG